MKLNFMYVRYKMSRVARAVVIGCFGFFAAVPMQGPAGAWQNSANGPSDDGALASVRQRYRMLSRHAHLDRRLKADWQQFAALPAARKAQLLKLNADLRQQPSAIQARLVNTMERYADWLMRLPAEHRNRVAQAPTTAVRLQIVRDLRDAEWMESQPKAIRDQWASLKATEKSEYVHKLRQAKEARKRDWQTATRFWRELSQNTLVPARITDLSKEEQVYVVDFLTPLLTPAEKERLKKYEGRWPEFASTLIDLSDRHPLALPTAHGPKLWQELPTPAQMLIRGKLGPKLKNLEGNWPGIAKTAVEFAQKRNLRFPNELWAYDSQCLKPLMQDFLDRTLIPLLSVDEKVKLLNASGKWPDYPTTVQALAADHDLDPPWHGLQHCSLGLRDRWEAYRTRPNSLRPPLPEVPAAWLRAFAEFELTPSERAELNLSSADPESFRRLRIAYFQRRREELRRLQDLDHAAESSAEAGKLLPTPSVP